MHGCVCRHVRVCVSKSFERSYMNLPAKCAALSVFSFAGRERVWGVAEKTTRLGEPLLLLCSLGLAWRYLSSCAT